MEHLSLLNSFALVFLFAYPLIGAIISLSDRFPIRIDDNLPKYNPMIILIWPFYLYDMHQKSRRRIYVTLYFIHKSVEKLNP